MAARTIGLHRRLFWLALTLILALAFALKRELHRVAGGCAGADAEDDGVALALAVMLMLALALALMLAFALKRKFLVYPDHFPFCPVLRRFHKDVICIEVDGHHDVAVASLGCMGESTRLVGVDFVSEVHHADKYVVEFGGRERLER